MLKAAPSSGGDGSKRGQPSAIVLAVAVSPGLKDASVLTLCFHWFLHLQEKTKAEEALLLGLYLMHPFSLQRGTVLRSLSKSCSLDAAADSLKRKKGETKEPAIIQGWGLHCSCWKTWKEGDVCLVNLNDCPKQQLQLQKRMKNGRG